MPAFRDTVNLYFSGSVDHTVSEYLLQHNVHRLFTYAYPKEVFEYLDRADQLGIRCNIMMDSGAFTAWNAGRPVVLRELMDYNVRVLNTYGQRHNFVFIALDVIPGERGLVPTAGDFARALDESKANFDVMQQHFKGWTIMPVYHSGEDISLRNHYMNLTDYLCLSMNQDWAEGQRLEWAKRVAIDGYRYHGLAATGNKMVSQIGWFSVDSSSWVTVGSMGNLLWPVGDEFRVLAISENSPARHDAGQHLKTLTPIEREGVERKIRRLGFDPVTLATEYRERWRWNIYQWVNNPWQVNVQRAMDLFGGM